MWPAHLDYLVDPVSGEKLTLAPTKSSPAGRVLEGTLTSPSGNVYHIVNGVPRFAPSDSYVQSFSKQWHHFKNTMLDPEHQKELSEFLATRLAIEPADWQGKSVLDVGVGAGKTTRLALDHGAKEVIGVDLSYSVDAALEHFFDDKRVTLVQGDIFHLPFRKSSFELVVSLGVLHHTPDCHSAFTKLPPLVQPGGSVAIGVYGGKGQLKHRVAAFYRIFLSRLPRSVMFQISRIAPLLYRLHRLPVVGTVFRNWLPAPVQNNITDDEKQLSFFDWYTPSYQSHHTKKEVFGWFEEAGLKNIKVLGDVGVRGWV